jgi:hypothetical protein
MQISALNLIIAAQQARHAPPQSAVTSKGSVARPAGASADSAEFAPFMSDVEKSAAAPAQRQNTPLPDAPLGSHIDIRV